MYKSSSTEDAPYAPYAPPLDIEKSQQPIVSIAKLNIPALKSKHEYERNELLSKL